MSLKQQLNPAGRPLVLTPEFRAQMEANQRMRLQPPIGKTEDWSRRIAGIPGDVLLALESLRMLAEQGNRVAQRLYVSETKRLGLWYDQKIWVR